MDIDLRDEIAMRAMQSLLLAKWEPEMVSELAYWIADEMLAARENK